MTELSHLAFEWPCFLNFVPLLTLFYSCESALFLGEIKAMHIQLHSYSSNHMSFLSDHTKYRSRLKMRLEQAVQVLGNQAKVETTGDG